MSRRHRQLRVRDPDVFLFLPATPLAHRHARILRTIPVDHTIFCFRYPDFHHGLLGMWFAASLNQFVIWRLIGGLGIGAASIIAPMYIAEIAPARLRGRLVTLYQLGIVLGILAAVFVNMLIQRMGNEAWNTTVGWRWRFFVGVIPALLFGLTIVPAVESPRW